LFLKKWSVNAVRNFGLLIGLLALASWMLFNHLYGAQQSLAYFSMPSRFWELAAGCLVYLVFKTKAAGFVRGSLPAFALLVLLVIALAMPLQVGSAVFRVTSIVLLASLLILVVRQDSLTHALLSSKLLVYIGLISYSLYLWHWPILSLSRLTIGIHSFTVPVQLMLMLALASFTFYKIETPFRQSNRLVLHPLSKGLFAVLVASGVMLFLAYKAAHRIFIGRVLNVDYPVWIRRPWFVGADGRGVDVCASGTEITKQQAKDCLAPGKSSTTTAYLIGDSHARNYVPAVKALFGMDSLRYLTVGSECSYSPPILQKRYRGKNIGDCLGYVDYVTNLLARDAREGDIVFVGQRLFVDYDKERQTEDYFDHILLLSRRLAEKGVPLVLLDGTYPPSKLPQECYPLPWKPFVAIGEGCFVRRDEVHSAFQEFERLAKSYQKSETNFFYVPLREGLCVGEACGQFMSSGSAIWRDMGHITDAASRELWLRLKGTLIDQQIKSRFPNVVF
jgi:hypothetical protein